MFNINLLNKPGNQKEQVDNKSILSQPKTRNQISNQKIEKEIDVQYIPKSKNTWNIFLLIAIIVLILVFYYIGYV